MSSRTRFPSRIRGIPLNHNVGRCRSVTSDGGRRRELVAQALGGGPGVLAFHMGVQEGGDFEELAVARFPDLEERARVAAALQGPALVEALFERLADEIFLQAFAAGVLQNAGQPVEFLPVEAVQRIGGVGHGAVEVWQGEGRGGKGGVGGDTARRRVSRGANRVQPANSKGGNWWQSPV